MTLHRLRQRERASLTKVWTARVAARNVLDLVASGEHEVVLACAARGSGKSLTCARLVLEALTSGGALHEKRGKVLLVAASSRTQASLVLEVVGRAGRCRRDIGLPHGREGGRRRELSRVGE